MTFDSRYTPSIHSRRTDRRTDIAISWAPTRCLMGRFHKYNVTHSYTETPSHQTYANLRNYGKLHSPFKILKPFIIRFVSITFERSSLRVKLNPKKCWWKHDLYYQNKSFFMIIGDLSVEYDTFSLDNLRCSLECHPVHWNRAQGTSINLLSLVPGAHWLWIILHFLIFGLSFS